MFPTNLNLHTHGLGAFGTGAVLFIAILNVAFYVLVLRREDITADADLVDVDAGD